MTTVVGFTTDWSVTPAVDELRSQIEGRPVHIPGKQVATFGGTGLQRIVMPLMELKLHGWDVHLSWQFRSHQDGHLEFMNTEGDWVSPECALIQRWMDISGEEVFRKARATGQRILNDCDDNFAFLPASNLAKKTTDPKLSPHFNREHYFRAMGASDAIIASTAPLAKDLERLGVPVHVVRNCIDLEHWPVLDAASDGAVGWIGGIAWRAADLKCLRPAVNLFCQEFSWPFYHGGDSEDPAVERAWDQAGVDITKVQVWAAPLCHIAQYKNLWQPMRIPLVPLEKCQFNRSKSFLKALEASACGLPYIVSAGFPEQQILIDEGGAGRVARNDKPMSWYDHMVDLLDPDVRAAEGKQNRAVAEKHNIHDRWVDWDMVLKEVLAA